MTRRLVVAPDKYKGALDAAGVAAALARGFVEGFGEELEVRSVPMADGGEGTVDAFVAAGAGRVTRRVRGPLGDPVDAAFALDGSTAIVEMAAASGFSLIARERRDPLRASTYGTGELIRAALDAGARRIVVGIGGSATNDGGAGMLQALGAHLLDASGAELAPGGAALAQLARIDLAGMDPGLGSAHFEVASDVDNPLCGPNGASAVFGPQKGASATDVATLDAALAHFADLTATATGQDHRGDAGAGAAGGLGFGLIAYLNGKLRPGVEIVAELRGLDEALTGASICLTGEGSIDAQTLHGKTVAGVGRLAHACGVKLVVAFGGALSPDAGAALAELGIVAVPIGERPQTLDEAIAQTGPLLERAAARTARLLRAGERL